MAISGIALPHSPAPRVSIVVLTRSSPAVLERCARSLARHLPRHIPLETIVLLNGADDDLRAAARSIRGLTVIESRLNLGFAAGCNDAATHARGEFLVLLNDDTEVERGWLEELVAAAEQHPQAGAIGSLVLFPDGRVQEAGSFIRADGWTTPIGRGGNAADADFLVTRPVHFCSGCALLIRRHLWDAIGGLPEVYYPAYYEDADFCLSLRAAGCHVLCAPASRVRHFEATTAGRTFRDFLIRRHRRQFITRHRAAIAEIGVPPELLNREPAPIWVDGGRRRLLVIDDRLPDGRLGSGFGRMRQLVEELAPAGYAVTLCPTDGPRDLETEVGRLGIAVSRECAEDHLRAAGRLYDAVVISRPNNFEHLADLVRRTQPHAALIYDAEALFHRRLERQAELGGNAAVRHDAAELRAIETSIARRCDAVVCVSEEEAEFFRRLGAASVSVIVPVWRGRVTQAPFRHRSGAVLVAGWLGGNESPNADGLLWFAREVMPAIVQRVPWFRLAVTGVDPPPAVRALAERSIALLGPVDELYNVYDRTRLAISPIRFGSGIKMKMVEAIAHGVPVVATTLGAEGARGLHAGAVCVADDPRDFADAVVQLLLHRTNWEQSRAGALRTADGWRNAALRGWRETLDEAQLTRTPEAVAGRVRGRTVSGAPSSSSCL